jgi:predicted nucleic acid-binding protein
VKVNRPFWHGAYTHPGTEAIIDDLADRRCAAALGIPVRGTLGLILIAKRQGRIPQARPVFERLRHAGMYLSDRVMNQALGLVGE